MTKTYWEEYFANVSPSWMENWYVDLKHLTIPSVYFRILQSEALELLKLAEGDAKIPNSFMEKLEVAFAAMLGEIDLFFVRLGSRSPKDNPTEIRSPGDVLRAFSDSERVLEDLMLCTNINYDPYLFLREWVDIPRSSEFRCFVKGGELRGISQYFYREKYYFLDDADMRELIKDQAESLLVEIRKGFKLKDFIFDISYRGTDLPLLIEINPFSSWTDPCLFDWALDKFDEFEFKWLEKL